MQEKQNSGSSRTEQSVNATGDGEKRSWKMYMMALGKEIAREDAERREIEKRFADAPEEQMEALYEFDLERQATGSGGWRR